MRLSLSYLLGFAFVLMVEVAIALWVDDAVVRPYGGDALVVVLLYCLVLALFALPKAKVALGVVLFAFAVEGAQALDAVDRLGLGHSRFWRVVIGTHFSVTDLVAYVVGGLLIALLEALPALRRVRR